MAYVLIFAIAFLGSIFGSLVRQQYLVKYYRHYKGNIYKLLIPVASLESDPVIDYVVYQSVRDHKVWIRKRKEFHGLVEDSVGNKYHRFDKITVFGFLSYAVKRLLKD